jgi:hypothetical protein
LIASGDFTLESSPVLGPNAVWTTVNGKSVVFQLSSHRFGHQRRGILPARE